MNLVAKYNNQLIKHPLRTKVLTHTFLAALGDITTQNLIEKGTYDPKRTLRFAGIVFCVTGPMNRTWIDIILPRLANEKNSKRGVALAVRKVAMDALLYGPFVISTFVGLNYYFSGKVPKDQVIPKLKNEIPDALKIAWCFWIPAQLINFRFVPGQCRFFRISIRFRLNLSKPLKKFLQGNYFMPSFWDFSGRHLCRILQSVSYKMKIIKI